jgi:hypothetical protein
MQLSGEGWVEVKHFLALSEDLGGSALGGWSHYLVVDSNKVSTIYSGVMQLRD